MSWNYRIIRRRNESGGFWYALHEVHYIGNEIDWWSAQPAPFVSDKPSEDEARKDITGSMRMALDDALARPILHEEDLPRSKRPAT